MLLENEFEVIKLYLFLKEIFLFVFEILLVVKTEVKYDFEIIGIFKGLYLVFLGVEKYIEYGLFVLEFLVLLIEIKKEVEFSFLIIITFLIKYDLSLIKLVKEEILIGLFFSIFIEYLILIEVGKNELESGLLLVVIFIDEYLFFKEEEKVVIKVGFFFIEMVVFKRLVGLEVEKESKFELFLSIFFRLEYFIFLKVESEEVKFGLLIIKILFF